MRRLATLILALWLVIGALAAPARAQLSAADTAAGAPQAGSTANALILLVGVVRSMNDLLYVPVRLLPSSTNTSATVTVAITNGATTFTAYAVKRASGGLLVNPAVGDLGVGVVAEIVWDGTEFVLVNPATLSLALADQTVSGGANVTSLSLGTVSTGSLTVDCGARPLQYLTNGGSFTLVAPAHDGSCIIQVTNNASAGTISFSGFTVNSSYTGGALNTTNTNKFMISITEVNGSATYVTIPQQ